MSATGPSGRNLEHNLRTELAEEEATAELNGATPIHEVSPSSFIASILELEDQQCVPLLTINFPTLTTRRRQVTVQAMCVAKSSSPQARTSLIERRTRLQRGIASLRGLQSTYTNMALLELRKTATDVPIDTSKALVELVPLLPPTALAALGYNVSPDLLQMEIRFREAQLLSSLHDLRNQLFVKSRLLTQKNLHARHQGPATRARFLLERNDLKIQQYAEKYRAARAALKEGYGNQESLVLFQKLADSDIRCLADDESTAGARIQGLLGPAHVIPTPITTGGSATISWIWMGVDTTDTETLGVAIAEAVRVEFCKAWARERRWNEEKQLVREEMRRTLVTFRWEAERWEAGVGDGAGPEVEGRNAYAYRQAYIRRAMAAAFETLWATPAPPAKPRARQVVEPTEGEYGDALIDYDADEDRQEGLLDP